MTTRFTKLFYILETVRSRVLSVEYVPILNWLC